MAFWGRRDIIGGLLWGDSAVAVRLQQCQGRTRGGCDGGLTSGDPQAAQRHNEGKCFLSILPPTPTPPRLTTLFDL
ncbi:hypothetical protein JZ751_000260 [Albula glossodonta]|uniref:Uncharacterized protein n=1 Tax=Albula glossodonta TaxID=121402 RepID=A0A8T2PV99_9TELE|nr:hypothetical protein JZ751_000260 [Albula glossodonta]